MSRNQDIEFLHMLTQEPYSVCRAIMKKNHWDLSEVLIDRGALERIVAATEKAKEAIEGFQKSLIPLVESLIDQSRVLLNQYKLLDKLEGHKDD